MTTDVDIIQRARLDALARTGLVDAPPEPGLQRLADLAVRVLDVPVCLVTLVDDHRQFFAAQSGSPEQLQRDRQTPLSHSLCQFVVEDQADLVIEDTRELARTRDNGAVTDLDVVAYAGVPLATPDGVVYGSLCAIDFQPREWSHDDLATLHALGEAVASEIEVRALLAERDEALATQLRFRKRLEAKRKRVLMLARIGETTDAVDDHRLLARAVAQHLVPELCDWCVVEIAPHELEDKVVAIGAPNERQRAAVEELRTLARATDEWESPTLRAYESHEPVYLERVEATDMVSTGTFDGLPPRLVELIDQVGIGTVSSMPLVSHERVLGSISFVRTEAGAGFDDLERDLQGEVARRLAMAVESGRLREALQHRARAAEVIEAIGDGVVLAGEDGRVSLWNPAAERIIGVSEADALGRQLETLAPQLAAVAQEQDDPDGAGTMVKLQRVDGETRWLSVTAVHIDGSAVFALRDVTDEHLLEQTRHELIATVSHQLRTPVASILAAAVTLQREDIALPPTTISTIIDTIVQQSQRLVDLCGDVLLASRLDSGAHKVNVDHVPLAPLLAELVGAAQIVDDTHTVVLDVPEPSPVALGDEHGLRQLFGNLLDNAIKYSPDGGEIRVESWATPGGVCVAIQDPGIGIPVSEHDRVFERFYRLDPHMRRGVGGSGLGLYVVRGLARLMGGHVEIEQPATGGTRMVVTIPSA